MWDLSFLTRDRNYTPCFGSRVLATGPPGKSHLEFFSEYFWSVLVKFLDTKNTDIEGHLHAPLPIEKNNNKGNFGPTQYLPQAPVSDCFFGDSKEQWGARSPAGLPVN